MIQLRRAQERGHINHGWLDTYHTFSFGEYVDPNHRGFRWLRVINEDKVAPGQGFQTHAHNDMEILTYIISGALEHKDSMGNGSVIRAGEIQYMSAGTGVTHSEFNPLVDKEVHLLQIWIRPDKKGYPPRYAQKKIPAFESLQLLAGPEGAGGLIDIRQDAKLFAGKLSGKQNLEYALGKSRGLWIHVIGGGLEITGTSLSPGDGVAIEAVEKVSLSAVGPSEFLLFDLS